MILISFKAQIELNNIFKEMKIEPPLFSITSPKKKELAPVKIRANRPDEEI